MTEVAAGTAGALLAGLDPEQREVALAARGAVCVLAGAGAGKTRAITHRIAYAAAIGVVDPAARAGAHLHRAGGRRAARPGSASSAPRRCGRPPFTPLRCAS